MLIRPIREKDAFFYCTGYLVASAVNKNWEGCLVAIGVYFLIWFPGRRKRKHDNNKRNIRTTTPERDLSGGDDQGAERPQSDGDYPDLLMRKGQIWN